MAIAQRVAQIRSAVFGKDVREAIAGGIEECYNDVSRGRTAADDAAEAAQTAAQEAHQAATTIGEAVEAATAAAEAAEGAAEQIEAMMDDAETAIASANTATTSANSAADTATAAANTATNAAGTASTAASAARTAANNAASATTAANNAASAADTAAQSASSSATSATNAAGSANTAASAANTAAGDAVAAAQDAADAADEAEEAAAAISGMTVEASTGANTGATITDVDGHKHISFTIQRGEKGDPGKDFRMRKTFSSIAQMEAYDPETDPSTSKVEPYDLVMIDTGSVEDADTGKVYCYEPETLDVWRYVADLSGAQGIKGETGKGISNVTLNQDGTLTFTYSDGTSYTSGSVKGPKGDTGNNGQDGKDGAPGVGISQITQNQDYSLTITLTNGTSYTTDPVRGPQGAQGNPGTAGSDGVGILSTVLNADYTLTINFTDGTSYTTPNSIRGPQGATGANGQNGTGITSITQNADYSLTIALDNGTTYTTDPVRGPQGAQGNPGTAGSDGVGISSIVQNADYTLTFNFTNGTSFTTPNPVIGPQGAAGADGQDGQDGSDGADGQNAYVHIRYAAAQPTQDSDMKTAPDDWMGVYSGNSATAPTTYTSYTWFRTRGVDGHQGVDGDPGEDATVDHTEYAYQVSQSGSTVPTGTWESTRPAVPQGSWLWTRTTIVWNDNQTTVLYNAERNPENATPSTLRTVPFSIGVNDWTLANGVYTATCQTVYVTGSSVESVEYTSSFRNAIRGDLNWAKASGNGGITFTTDVAPVGTLEGEIRILDSDDGRTSVVLQGTVMPIANGGTGANTLAGAKTNLGIADLEEKIEGNDLAIIERGDTATHSIAEGKYVSWKGKIGKAKNAIQLGATLSDSLFDYDEEGALNALNASLGKWNLIGSFFGSSSVNIDLTNYETIMLVGVQNGRVASVTLPKEILATTSQWIYAGSYVYAGGGFGVAWKATSTTIEFGDAGANGVQTGATGLVTYVYAM